MLAALVGSVLVFIVWGAASNRLAPDTASAALIALYVPALVSFAMMLLHADDGVSRIITFILVTIGSDIGGYVAGVLFGKHPMAPTVSPKKSWEGFAGSWLSCVVIGVLTVTLILHAPFWVGILLGSLVVVAATVGDLCESMIKRDLGIKDMSNLIPGHGGRMAGELGQALAMPGATLSFHLKELSHSGLVTSRREGRSIIYSAAYPALSGLVAFVMRDCCQGHPEVCGPAVAALATCCEPVAL